MSSSEKPVRGRLEVSSPGALVGVVDAFFGPVEGGTAVGGVNLLLPQGAYRVTANLSGAQLARTVVVRSRRKTVVDLQVQYDAAAPVDGTDTVNETHAELAAVLTRRRTRSRSMSGALVVVVRGLRDRPMAALETTLDVVDEEGRGVEVGEPTPAPHGDPARPRAYGWRLEPPPGGYRVRWKGQGGQHLEHAVWIVPGWQTVMFVPVGTHGPVVADASVHVLRAGATWQMHTRESRALEETLARLRGGSGGGPGDAWQWALDSKQSPMLQLLTLHELLRLSRAGRIDVTAAPYRVPVQRAARGLFRALAGHPDAQAVMWALGEKADSVFWPPMLVDSLDLLLEADRDRPWVITDGSPAECASGLRFASGPWLLWDPEDLVAAQTWAPPPRRAARAAPAVRNRGVDGVRGGPVSGGGGQWVARPGDPLDSVVIAGQAPAERRPPPRALSRVERLVADVAPILDRTPADTARHLGADEVARRLGMTTGLAQACLDSML